MSAPRGPNFVDLARALAALLAAWWARRAGTVDGQIGPDAADGGSDPPGRAG